MTKTPDYLEIGDCFSYPGSFKIYQVQTKPEVDPAFKDLLRCTGCGQLYLPTYRLIFEVTDRKLNDHMGIRLRSDVVCTIHSLEELIAQATGSTPLVKQLEAIVHLGHFENWGDGMWRFYFDDMDPEEPNAEDGLTSAESSSFEETVSLAYEAYKRGQSPDLDQT